MRAREWPTIPDLSKVTGVPECILYGFAEEGVLITLSNPQSRERKKRFIPPFRLPKFLKDHLYYTEGEAKRIMEALGFDFFNTLAA